MLCTKAAILQYYNTINSAVTVPGHAPQGHVCAGGSLEGLLALCAGWWQPGFAASQGRDTIEGCPGCSGVTSRRGTCHPQCLPEVSWPWPPGPCKAFGSRSQAHARSLDTDPRCPRCLWTPSVGRWSPVAPRSPTPGLAEEWGIPACCCPATLSGTKQFADVITRLLICLGKR